LVEFASVVDAVRRAAELQAALTVSNAPLPPDRRIEFRIGIHQGDIVVEDGDIFGDGVNVAARLEGLAEPGGICVSARVQEDAAGKPDLLFEDIGEQQLKNIARPVRIYRVVTPTRPAMPQPGANPPLPDKPSIAVLPFANMSGDPEQEYFVNGMVEENTSQSHDPSNSAAFTSPAGCQVDSLMYFFGLAVNRLQPAGLEVQFLDR
jgi:adenylate cyclase